jgi:hypothetical protein
MNAKWIDLSSLAGYAVVGVLAGAGMTDGLAQVNTAESSAPDKVIVFLAENCDPNCLRPSVQVAPDSSDVVLRTPDGRDAPTFKFAPTGDLKKFLDNSGASCNPNCLGHVVRQIATAGPKGEGASNDISLRTKEGVKVRTIVVPMDKY